MTGHINAEALLRNTGDGAAVVGADGRILLWNHAAERIFGRTASEVVGRHCWNVSGGCDVNGNRVCLSPCSVRILLSRGERVRHFHMATANRKGDPIWIDVSTLRDAGGHGRNATIVHLFRDVTAEHRQPEAPTEATRESRATGRRHQAAPRTQALTARELEVLGLLRTGATTARIATELDISATTVRNHIQNIFQKLGVHSRLAAVTRMASGHD